MQEQNNNQKRPRRRGFDLVFWLFIIALVVGVVLLIRHLTTPKPKELDYQALITEIQENNVDTSS
ncbi:MAG: hypothetical protein K2G50_02320, partial [Anaeroplasmataceae bacterium]|nr:hypothetical protein [Anaeroplasmataceae bacterium]